jgi:hypothetical protein
VQAVCYIYDCLLGFVRSTQLPVAATNAGTGIDSSTLQSEQEPCYLQEPNIVLGFQRGRISLR